MLPVCDHHPWPQYPSQLSSSVFANRLTHHIETDPSTWFHRNLESVPLLYGACHPPPFDAHHLAIRVHGIAAGNFRASHHRQHSDWISGNLASFIVLWIGFLASRCLSWFLETTRIALSTSKVIVIGMTSKITIVTLKGMVWIFWRVMPDCGHLVSPISSTILSKSSLLL